MNEVPTVFQRRIIIGAVLSIAAFALVGIRLVHVTLLKSWEGGRAAIAMVARADLTDRNGELLARDLRPRRLGRVAQGLQLGDCLAHAGKFLVRRRLVGRAE